MFHNQTLSSFGLGSDSVYDGRLQITLFEFWPHVLAGLLDMGVYGYCVVLDNVIACSGMLDGMS